MKTAFLVLFLGVVLFLPAFGGSARITNVPTLASSTATLKWDKVRDRAVKGYRLHYRTASGRSYSRMIDVGQVTTYTISNLMAGKTYYFVVTAYNGAGKESPPSNEISFAVSASASTRPQTTSATPNP